MPNARLGQALGTALREFLPGVPIESGDLEDGSGGVVIAAPGSCSPSECRRLAQQGTRIIVISPIALVSERRIYEEAGVFAYLPMQIDATELIANAVKLAIRHGHRRDGWESRTTSSHELSPRAC